jgi:16S rRNA (uracil1498-N3)-methyltransferase
MREPDAVRELLVEGLSQCEVDCLVPEVTICKSFWDFTKKVDLLFPSEKYRRLLAHPLFEWDERDDFMKKYDVESAGIENSRRVFDMDSKMALEPDQQIVVCVGPEGGWERREVAKFLQEDFQLVNLGERILRTDMAVSIAVDIWI